MSLVPDQRVVEQFAGAAADPTLHDCVRAGGLDGTLQDPDAGSGEDRVEKAAVNLVSRSRSRNLIAPARSLRSMSRFRACCVTQALLGWAVTPRIRMRRVACSITARA